jgi:hypothetical protein
MLASNHPKSLSLCIALYSAEALSLAIEAPTRIFPFDPRQPMTSDGFDRRRLDKITPSRFLTYDMPSDSGKTKKE